MLNRRICCSWPSPPPTASSDQDLSVPTPLPPLQALASFIIIQAAIKRSEKLRQFSAR